MIDSKDSSVESNATLAASRDDAAAQVARSTRLVDPAQRELDPQTLAGLMAMANEPRAFMTDRDPNRVSPATGAVPKPYPPEVVGQCALTAVAYGLRVIGNEFNIVNGRAVVTLTGLSRLLREVPDFEFLSESVGTPRPVGGKGWLLTIAVRARVKGRVYSIEHGILVPGPAGPAGVWAVRAAKLQVFAQLYEQITGLRLPYGEAATQEQEEALHLGQTVPVPNDEQIFAPPTGEGDPHPGRQWGQPERVQPKRVQSVLPTDRPAAPTPAPAAPLTRQPIPRVLPRTLFEKHDPQAERIVRAVFAEKMRQHGLSVQQVGQFARFRCRPRVLTADTWKTWEDVPRQLVWHICRYQTKLIPAIKQWLNSPAGKAVCPPAAVALN